MSFLKALKEVFILGSATKNTFADENSVSEERSENLFEVENQNATLEKRPKRNFLDHEYEEDYEAYSAADREFEEHELSAERAKTRIAEIARPHLAVLNRKYRQTVYLDDYGNRLYDKWHAELLYFTRRMISSDPFIASLEFFNSKYLSKDDQLSTILGCYVESEWDLKSPSPRGDYHAEMDGLAFERYVAAEFEREGGTVRFTAASGDQGVDILVEESGRTLAVQCKRSKATVGNKAVQEVAAGRGFYEAMEAWVVSDAQFTVAARQLAATLGVELVHHEEIATALTRTRRSP